MTDSSACAEWMDRFRRELRYSSWFARRIHAEVQDHLLDEVARLMSQGIDRDEAERRAIEAFGDPETIARAFEDGGGPMFSPKSLRYLTLFAALLALPSVFFVIANWLNFELGTTSFLYDNTIDPVLAADVPLYEILLNASVMAGPVLALALVALASTELGIERADGTLRGHFTVRLTKSRTAVALVSVAMLMIMAAYFVLENGPCWWGVTWC